MFFSSPSTDLTIIIWLLGFSFFISLFTFLFFRRILFSLFIFSILANLVFYFGTDYSFRVYYNISNIEIFVNIIWPIINIILLVFLIIKNRLAKKKKNARREN
jgi:hypothetical protein